MLPKHPHHEDPIIAAPPPHLERMSIQSGKTKIFIYIYGDGSSGYYITTAKDKGNNPSIRIVTENTAEVIKDVAHHGHIIYGTDMSYYGPIDPHKSGIENNIGRVPTNNQEQTNTDDSLERLLRDMDKLITNE